MIAPIKKAARTSPTASTAFFLLLIYPLPFNQLAGDEIDKNFLLKVAYNGWIKDHCVTLEQFTSLVYDLTGVTVENQLKMPGGMDAVLFLAEPDHLFDPKLLSAVKVSGKNDGASEFTIDADYFAQLVGIQPKQADAKLLYFPLAAILNFFVHYHLLR